MAISDYLKSKDNPGANAVGDSEAIKEKMNNINSYKNSLQSPKPAAGAPAKPYTPSSMDKVNPSGKYGQQGGEKRPDQLDIPGLPKLRKGAKIKKARIVKVHAKEVVLPKGRAKKAAKMGLAKGLQSI